MQSNGNSNEVAIPEWDGKQCVALAEALIAKGIDYEAGKLMSDREYYMMMRDQVIPKVPEVPKDTQVEGVVHVNDQCADIENWDDKAYPLLMERLDGQPTIFPEQTISAASAEVLVALLTKPLKLVTPGGFVSFNPIVEDNPDLKGLVTWLRGASASLRSRRSRRPQL